MVFFETRSRLERPVRQQSSHVPLSRSGIHGQPDFYFPMFLLVFVQLGPRFKIFVGPRLVWSKVQIFTDVLVRSQIFKFVRFWSGSFLRTEPFGREQVGFGPWTPSLNFQDQIDPDFPLDLSRSRALIWSGVPSVLVLFRITFREHFPKF